MADGQTPGNGTTSPFGNGNGGGGSSAMAGNNFVENPRGTNLGTGSIPSFTEPPPEKATQKPRNDTDPTTGMNTADAAGGATTAAEEADASGDDSGGFVGVGSIGNSQKPFSLGGGGA